MDSISSKVIWHKFIQSETKENYLEGLLFLEQNEFEILSVTIDGRRGIADVFKNYPVQICQFHIYTRISKLLTKKPKTEAGKDLKQINDPFIYLRLSENELGRTLARFCHKHSSFLEEINDKGKPKHKRIIQDLKTFKRSMKKLFVYQDYPELNIPNTTNHLDGGINPKIKDLARKHRGMRKSRRNKLITVLLNSLGK